MARVQAAEDFPALSGRIRQLMAVLDDEDTSVQRLANLIIQDYSLTVKLLRTANSFQFNRSGVPVVSATHAIVMMGAQTVRDLVSSIVVFEHYQRRSPGLRELLMLSLLSANHARELADRTGALRDEESYLLGMLRNLGEVLVACYLPDEYGKVLKDMADTRCPASLACRRVLHFDYEELARIVVRDWNMPPSIARVLSDGDTERADPVHTVVSFSHELTTAVYRHGSGSPHQAVNMLLQKYASLALNREDIGAVLEAGLAGTRETFQQARVQLNELKLKHQMMSALIERPDTVAHRPARESTTAAAISDQDVSRQMSAVLQALEDDGLELNKAILIVLEATLTAGGFDRAVLALVSSSRREICGRLGLGRNSDDIIARFRFPLGVAGGPVGVAASRGQELMIAKSWELMPDEQRLLRTLDVGAVLLLPLAVDGRIVGALYTDTMQTAQPSESAVAVARQMRDAMANAMARRRTSPGPS